jgi:hypothetical protein
MLFKEIMAVYFEHHAIHINALCEHSAELVIIKAGGIYTVFIIGL